MTAPALPDGWQSVRLGDIARERTQRASVLPEADVFSVTKHAGFVRSLEYFDRQVFSRDTRNYKAVFRGDLAYATIHLDEGSLGILRDSDVGLISPMYTVFEPDLSQAEPEFLFALMKLPQMVQRYQRIGEGTVHRRKSISFKRLGRLAFAIPSLLEQRRILSVLDSIDEAIERTEEVIAATGRLRDALLHELLTRGLPGRHSEWADVPGLGTVPASWDVVSLGEICAEPIRNGFSAGPVEAPTGWWLLTLAAVSPSGFVPEAKKQAPLDARLQSFRLVPGDLLVSRSNTRDRVGLAGVYRGIPENCSYPDLLMRVRVAGSRALVEFVEAALLSVAGRAYFERRARGTSGSMVKITGDILRSFPLALPTLDEQRAIAAALRGVDGTIERAREERARLHSLQASAADALLTGRVRVASGTVER